MLDLLLKGGLVVDPANHVQSVLNLGIRNGRIARLTLEEPPAAEVVDCAGLLVCPGFVDAHSHEDGLRAGAIQADITLRALRQGVTTLVGGNCGSGPRDLPAYRVAYDAKQPVNLALLAGHTTLRRLCGARDKYAPVSPETVQAMCATLEKQMTQGAVGLSMGIRYEPGMTLEEMCAVARVVRRFDGVVAAHIRSDAFEVFDALDEFLEIGRRTGVRLQISHIGSMAAYGQMERVLSQIDRAAAEGLDVRIDCYPYDAFCTSIGATTYDDGFLERYHDVTRIELTDGEHKGFIPNMEVFRQVRREHPETLTVAHVMNEEEIDMALRHPRTMLGSDGILHNGAGHPRAAGAFVRFLKRYVFERRLLSLDEGIAKMTCQAARRFGLPRGTLGMGCVADVAVLDPARLADRATFAEPALPPEGVRMVVLGGAPALRDGEVVRMDMGRML